MTVNPLSIDVLLSARSYSPFMALPRRPPIVIQAGKLRIGHKCRSSFIEKATLFPKSEQVKEGNSGSRPYIPVYVMLPLRSIESLRSEFYDFRDLIKQLKLLKSTNVDGVTIECLWKIVEYSTPQIYIWSGYRKLFQIVRDLDLKLQVVMCFHGWNREGVNIPLPLWITGIGLENPDIYFTDKEGRRSHEYLTWGIDSKRVLRGRSAIDVYCDFMRSFRVEFDEFFEEGLFSEIEIGLGPRGELRYPSYNVNHGWEYPGIGEFQCYDKYLIESLREAAEARQQNPFIWGKPPRNAGSYNSKPLDTGFFCDGGDYDEFYGRFFLKWYSDHLVDHADRVLAMAKSVFVGTPISIKLPIIHWWYNTPSHAAELTAGFYNSSNRDGYKPIASILKKHGIRLNFTCVDQPEGFPEAFADPQGLIWQVLHDSWDIDIPMAMENVFPFHDTDGYDKILEMAKPITNCTLVGTVLFAFTYIRLCQSGPQLLEEQNMAEFERFVQRLHGKFVPSLMPTTKQGKVTKYYY